MPTPSEPTPAPPAPSAQLPTSLCPDIDDDQSSTRAQSSWQHLRPISTSPSNSSADANSQISSLSSQQQREGSAVSRASTDSPPPSSVADALMTDDASKEVEAAQLRPTTQAVLHEGHSRQRTIRPIIEISRNSERRPRVQLGQIGRGHRCRDSRHAASQQGDAVAQHSQPARPAGVWPEEVAMSNESTYGRRIPTSPSSFLRAGSRFRGTQQSERQQYKVDVEIKHVDLEESFLCGYLRIQGLTEDHPSLTTYFEGEIVGPRYTFATKHQSWCATDKVDYSHWSKFIAYRPTARHWRKSPPTSVHEIAQNEHIFMRWKEHFLVPDHRVRTITGASFEGFYYICFNQVRGEISGIYFHAKSEKFQQLELKHVEDRGCHASVEFR